MTTYCDIREVPDLDTLRYWARAMEVPVQDRGVTLEGDTICTATYEVTTLVCVVPGNQPPPLMWKSPFE